MIRSLLVDDEEPARARLRGMLAEHQDIEIVGEACDGLAAIERIAELRPDLVFLDIQMPGRSGVEVVAALGPPRPRVIFCTAFDQYAIDAFDHHALDYLLKPLKRDRLARAIERVRGSLCVPGDLESEMAQASRTQARLLPQSLPDMPGLDYAGLCRAARDVAGDYYDFLAVGPGRLGIAVADVSGKGLYAGLLMAGLQARIQTLAAVHADAVDLLAAEANRVMHASTETNRYATLFYGLYDDAGGTLNYVNAGHTPALLLRKGGGLERLGANGTVIGLVPEARYRRDAVRLEKGDVLIISTDGVTEALGANGEEFGERRLVETALRHVGRRAEEIRDAILQAVDDFRDTGPLSDDVTLVVACAT